jgi:hypothetical protein
MSKAEELAKLHELKIQGILSEEEFNAEKAKVLAAGSSVPPVAAVPAVQTISPSAGGHGHIQAVTNFASCNLIQVACEKCKGEVQFLPGLDLVRCTFCGHELSVGSKESAVAQIPNLLIPFKVTQAEVRQRFYNQLANDDYVPDSIFDEGTKIDFFGIFIPVYYFDGKYEGNWTALSIVKYAKTVNGKKVGEEEQATPISGTVRGLLKEIVVASSVAGDAGASMEAAELKSRLKQYEAGFVQGFLVESLVKAKSQEACEVLVRQCAQQLAQNEAIKMIPTSNYRNLAVNIDVTSNTLVFLQPLWGCEIKHNGTTYRVWLPGDQPNGVMSGKIPQDEGRKNLVKKLKSAGVKMYIVGGVMCCIGMMGIGAAQPKEGDPEKSVGLIIYQVLLIGGFLTGALVCFYKGWKKSKAGQAELAQTLFKSKQLRQNRMPAGIPKSTLTPPNVSASSGTGSSDNSLKDLKGMYNQVQEKTSLMYWLKRLKK